MHQKTKVKFIIDLIVLDVKGMYNIAKVKIILWILGIKENIY